MKEERNKTRISVGAKLKEFLENQILLEDDFVKALNKMTDKKKIKPKDFKF